MYNELVKKIDEATSPFKSMSREEYNKVATERDKEWDSKKAKYLQNPDHCPYCGSKNIGEQGLALRHCKDCDQEWKEIMGVVDIEEYI